MVEGLFVVSKRGFELVKVVLGQGADGAAHTQDAPRGFQVAAHGVARFIGQPPGCQVLLEGNDSAASKMFAR